MKAHILFFSLIIIWLVLTVLAGKYLTKLILKLGANFITAQDIIGFYILPAIVLGALAFNLFFYLLQKFKL